MDTLKRRVLLSLNAAVAASALLFSAGCHKKEAPQAEGPEAFTAQLPEVEGVQAILSLRHPSLINQDLEKLMAGVPEAGVHAGGAFYTTAAYGYPEFTDIAAGSNVGVAVLSLSGAEIKGERPSCTSDSQS